MKLAFVVLLLVASTLAASVDLKNGKENLCDMCFALTDALEDGSSELSAICEKSALCKSNTDLSEGIDLTDEDLQFLHHVIRHLPGIIRTGRKIWRHFHPRSN